MQFELQDIMFFISNVKNKYKSFNILEFVSFNKMCTRSSSTKLVHSRSSLNSRRKFYFPRLVRLWNALPVVDLILSINTLRSKVKSFLWSVFLMNFNSDNSCSFHFLCPCNRCFLIPVTPNFTHLDNITLHST